MHVPDLCFDSQSIHFKEGSNKHIASHQTRKRSRPTSPFTPPVRLFCFRAFESEVKVLFTQSCPLFVTPWTVAFQAPLSIGFSRKEYWSGAGSRHTRSHPWQGHEGENLTGKADQIFRGFEKASSQDPTHDKVTRRKPDRQGRSGFQGFQKAAPGAHLKDDICLSDACLNRLLPNFSDTGKRPSLIALQIRINLEL